MRGRHVRVDRRQRLQRQRPGARVVQHPVRRRQGEQDEGEVIQVGRAVNHATVVVGRSDPQAVVAAAAGDQAVQAGARNLAASLPTQGRAFAEDIDLACLDPRAARQARQGPAVEIQLLPEPPVRIHASLRPQGQGMVEQPGGDAVLSGDEIGHGLGLGRLAPGAKSPGDRRLSLQRATRSDTAPFGRATRFC